jgi:hypothetical protein
MECGTIADRAFQLRQIEEARRAVQHARRLYDEMPERDVREFAARMSDLERASDAADRFARPKPLTFFG